MNEHVCQEIIFNRIVTDESFDSFANVTLWLSRRCSECLQ